MINKIPEETPCRKCINWNKSTTEEPCLSCRVVRLNTNWQPTPNQEVM